LPANRGLTFSKQLQYPIIYSIENKDLLKHFVCQKCALMAFPFCLLFMYL